MSVDLHRQAESLMDRAETAALAGRTQDAESLFFRAAELEEQVLAEIPDSRPRTRGIIAVSATSLYRKAKAHDMAIRLAHRCLADGNMLSSAKNSLYDLLDSCRRDSTTLDEGYALSARSLLVSLEGPAVGYGVAAADTVMLKLTQVANYATRIAEWAAECPFRTSGPVAQSVSGTYNLVVTQPTAGSFRFGLGVTAPAQPPLPDPGKPDFSADGIAATFFDVVDAIARDNIRSLEQKVPDPQYREVFLRHIQNFAPDGKKLTRIGISRIDASGVATTELVSDTRKSASKHLPKPTRRAGQHEEVKCDILRGLQLNQSWIVLGDAEREQKCWVQEVKLFEDVIGPFVNHRVRVPGRWDHNRFILSDVVLDDDGESTEPR